MHILKYWWFYFLLGTGILWRLWFFGRIPASLYWDEMAIWDDARSIATTGYDLHHRSWLQPLFISYGDYKLPLYIWLTSLVSWVWPPAITGVRLISLLAGLVWLPGIYWLAKNLGWSSSKSLLAVALAAVMPWAVHFSKVGFEGHLAAVLLTWSVVGLLAIKNTSIRKQKIVWFVLAVLTAIGAFYSYFSIRYVWPLLVVILAIIFHQKRWSYQSWLMGALIVWSLATVPMWRADFYQASNQLRLSTVNVVSQPDRVNQVNLYRARSGNTLLSRLFYNQYTFIARDLSTNMWTFMDPTYLFLTGDSNLRHNSTGRGLMLLMTAPFFVVGWLYLFRYEKRTFALLMIWWLLAIVPAAVPLTVPHALRSLNALAVFPLVLSAGWWWSLKTIPSRYKKATLIVLLILITSEIIWSIYYTTWVYPHTSATDWQAGYLPTAQYLANHHQEYDHVLVDVADDRFYLYYLPYSSLSWQQIQEKPTEGFHFWQLENINFQSAKETDMASLSGKMLLVKLKKNANLDKQPVISFGPEERKIVIYER